MRYEYSDYKDAVKKRLLVTNAQPRDNINRQSELCNLLMPVQASMPDEINMPGTINHAG